MIIKDLEKRIVLEKKKFEAEETRQRGMKILNSLKKNFRIEVNYQEMQHLTQCTAIGLHSQNSREYEEERARSWYYPDPEHVEIPPEMTQFLEKSLRMICQSFVHEIQRQKITLQQLHNSMNESKNDLITRLVTGKDCSTPGLDRDLPGKPKSLQIPKVELMEVIERLCFQYMLNIVENDHVFRRVNSRIIDEKKQQYSERVLKKILFRKSMEDNFYQQLLTWTQYAEEHQMMKQAKLFEKLDTDEEAEVQVDTHQQQQSVIFGLIRKNAMNLMSSKDKQRLAQKDWDLGIQDYLKYTTNQYFTQNHHKLHEGESHGHSHDHKGSHSAKQKKKPKKKHGHNHGSQSSENSDNQSSEEDDHETPEIKLKVALHKLELANKQIGEMRIKFTKQLMHYQETLNLSASIKAHGFKYIDVKYFDGAEILNDDIRYLLNAKIHEMRDKFETNLQQKDKDIKELNRQISIFRSLEKDGNIGITFDEMNADAVIKKLSFICWDSQQIWDACTKHYKKGFFNNPIEIEFGITPDTHEQLIQRFDRKIKEFKVETKANIESIFKKFEAEKADFVKQIADKDQEMFKFKNECQKEILRQRNVLQEQFEFRLQKEMEVYNKLSIDEKQELYAEIQILKDQNRNVEELQKEFVFKMFFQKWFFFSKLGSLRDKYHARLTDAEIQKEVKRTIRIERLYFQKQLEECMKNSGPEIAKLRSELQYVKEENRDIFSKLSQLEVAHHELVEQKEQLDKRYMDQSIDFENCKDSLKVTLKSLEFRTEDAKELKDTCQKQGLYIESLETESKNLKDKIQKLNERAKKHQEQQEIVNNSFQHLHQSTMKSLGSQKKDINSKMQNFFSGKYQVKGTITDLCGTENKLKVVRAVQGRIMGHIGANGVLMQPKSSQTQKTQQIGIETQVDETEFVGEEIKKTQSDNDPIVVTSFQSKAQLLSETTQSKNSLKKKQSSLIQNQTTHQSQRILSAQNNSEVLQSEVRQEDESKDVDTERSDENIEQDKQVHHTTDMNVQIKSSSPNAEDNEVTVKIFDQFIERDEFKIFPGECTCAIHKCRQRNKSNEKLREYQMSKQESLKYKNLSLKNLEKILDKNLRLNIPKRDQYSQTHVAYENNSVSGSEIIQQNKDTELFDWLQQELNTDLDFDGNSRANLMKSFKTKREKSSQITDAMDSQFCNLNESQISVPRGIVDNVRAHQRRQNGIKTELASPTLTKMQKGQASHTNLSRQLQMIKSRGCTTQFPSSQQTTIQGNRIKTPMTKFESTLSEHQNKLNKLNNIIKQNKDKGGNDYFQLNKQKPRKSSQDAFNIVGNSYMSTKRLLGEQSNTAQSSLMLNNQEQESSIVILQKPVKQSEHQTKLIISVGNEDIDGSREYQVQDPLIEVQRLNEKNIKISSTPLSRQGSPQEQVLNQPQYFYKNKLPISVSSKNLEVRLKQSRRKMRSQLSKTEFRNQKRIQSKPSLLKPSTDSANLNDSQFEHLQQQTFVLQHVSEDKRSGSKKRKLSAQKDRNDAFKRCKSVFQPNDFQVSYESQVIHTKSSFLRENRGVKSVIRSQGLHNNSKSWKNAFM